MELKREEILSGEVIDRRMKEYGKIVGTWICENCKEEEISFIYNWEFHISSICKKCSVGKMIEDESRREKPSGAAMVRGKQGEDAWMAKQSPTVQADVLLGRDPSY